jgi:DNA-binding transcriptional LysR family regulator
MTPPSHLSTSWFVGARLKLRHLQLLAAFSRSATLHDAADHLGMSQPAASKLLNDLEALIGIALFRHEGRRLVPNYFGEVLTRRAITILDELDRTREELNALLDGRAGRVCIGAIDGPAIEILTRAIQVLQADYPQIDLDIRTGSSASLHHDLSRGHIEIMIGRPGGDVSERHLHYEEIGYEPLMLMGRSGHPLAVPGSASLNELSRYPWILQSRGSRSRQRLEAIFRDMATPLPARIVGSDSLVVTLAYLTQSDALTVLSGPVACQQMHAGQIAEIPNGLDLRLDPYGFLLPQDRPPSPAAATVIAVLRDATRRHTISLR